MVSELGKDALRRRPEGILFGFEGWQVISVFSPLWTPLIFVQLYSNMEDKEILAQSDNKYNKISVEPDEKCLGSLGYGYLNSF
ncbi:hypothetical protein D7X48_06855 [bacterium D16-50]|nr:hypothetical protein D7X48_06855 [bacterium D16-50]